MMYVYRNLYGIFSMHEYWYSKGIMKSSLWNYKDVVELLVRFMFQVLQLWFLKNILISY